MVHHPDLTADADADAEAFAKAMREAPEPELAKPPVRGWLFGQPTPMIHGAMVQAMNAVTHVGKDGYNTQQNYPFRGIDGVINALGPAMRVAGIFITSELLEIRYRDARTTLDKPTREVLVRVRYRFTAVDGSYVETEAPGESLDTGDKGTAKAMSVALRVALLQTFALPTQEPTTDHDGHHHTRGGEPRMSAFERTAGLALLAIPDAGQRQAAGAAMMRAALQQALDFRVCVEEHAAWLTPTNGDESPTWEELFTARVAAEIEACDNAADINEVWRTLKTAQLDMEHDGKRFSQLIKERAQAIKDRNAKALDTLTAQVLAANLDDFEGPDAPVLHSIQAAQHLGRIDDDQANTLLQLAQERRAKLAAQGAALLNEAAPMDDREGDGTDY